MGKGNGESLLVNRCGKVIQSRCSKVPFFGTSKMWNKDKEISQLVFVWVEDEGRLRTEL